MRQAEYVASMGKTKNTSMALVRSLNKKDHEEELCVHRAGLKWTLKKRDRRAWTGFVWLTIQTRGEISGTTQRRRTQTEISLRVLWSKIRPETSKLHITEKYIKYRSRPNKYIGRALPNTCLRFPLCSPKRNIPFPQPFITCFSESSVQESSSWYRSWSLFKRETSSISLTVPGKGVLPPDTPHRAPIHETLCWQSLFYCLSKSPITEPPSRFPNGAPYEEMPVSRAFLYISFTVPCLCCNTVPISYTLLKLFVNYSRQTDKQKIIFAPPLYCCLHVQTYNPSINFIFFILTHVTS